MEPKATDVLANERTLLAYVRTALSFIGFGFVVARFGLFVEEFAQITHLPPKAHHSSEFGIAMAVVGIALGLFGGWRYEVMDRSMRGTVMRRLSPSLAYLISIVVAAIGLVVALYLSANA